jgi:hypothetical protein
VNIGFPIALPTPDYEVQFQPRQSEKQPLEEAWRKRRPEGASAHVAVIDMSACRGLCWLGYGLPEQERGR